MPALVTHDKAAYTARPITQLAEAAELALQYDVIGVDEAQFIPDVVDYADRFASAGKLVILACLDGTFQRLPFNNILELVPRAEARTHLRSARADCAPTAPPPAPTALPHAASRARRA